MKENYGDDYLSNFVYDLFKSGRLERIDEIIETAEVHHFACASVASNKGFTSFKNFLASMQRQKHMENNNVKQITVWDKIKKREERKKQKG